MDDHNNRHRRQQHDPHMHNPSDPRYPLHEQTQQQHHPHRQALLAGSSSDRFRPAPVNTSGSRSLGSGHYTGYYPESGASAFSGAISQSTLPYQSEYGQDTRQTAGFGSYGANVIYGVPQAGGQYDNSLFSARQQPGSGQIIPSDVSGSYSSFEAGAPGASSSLQHQQQATPSGAVVPYQQAQLPSFHSNLAGVPGMSQTAAQSADISMDDAPDYGQSAATAHGLEERWTEYQTRLAAVYRDIQSGDLESGRESLLGVSNWILLQIVELGLHLDNAELWPKRIKLWDNFNNAWLGLLQKQHDMIATGELQRGQTLISLENLEKMGSELVRLCDSIDRHGLVDYHYGVWEEQITNLLIECCNQIELEDEDDAGTTGSSLR